MSKPDSGECFILTTDAAPRKYTSGRWLRRDELEIESRYIQFNFDALCRKIIELCPGASTIRACRKIERGFNRVLIFTLDNAKEIVARLPFRLAGPARLTTLSEVATVRYFGCEYIIMEHANGVPLCDQWREVAGDQQVGCMNAIYRTIKEVFDLEFPAYKSIYFDDTLDSVDKQSLGDGFCIGLHCGTRYWGCDAGEQRIRNSAAPLMFHPDLHMRNIFVSQDDPSVITGIIDWKSTSVEPAFWYSDEIPAFAIGSELCTKAFELSSQFLTPKLSGPRLMNENLFRPFLALRHEMIETAPLWKKLGFEGRCPFPLPTREELIIHAKEYRLFETAPNLQADLCGLLNTASDGWRTFDGILQAVVSNPDVDDDEPVKNEMTLRVIWPFDLDQ
ncbi:uncharacterized protein BDW70DRAFT_166582 [Aspergillus foveolatus]|uniref:uncharacterized protein n=1 Tax=Aspergillus foveolatus TaxID=210207 RepID=UPI003CCDE6D3